MGMAISMGYSLIMVASIAHHSMVTVAAVVVGFLVADLISGVVHFWCDHVGTESTPVLGPIFVKHFLAHHARPNEIVEHDFVETNGNNFLASAVLLMPSYIAWWYVGSADNALLFVVSLSACGFLAITNQSHKWAHLPDSDNHRVVRILQRTGLVLSSERHLRHHRDGFDTNFCITSGALNPVLDRLRFFELLRWVFGASQAVEDRTDT